MHAVCIMIVCILIMMQHGAWRWWLLLLLVAGLTFFKTRTTCIMLMIKQFKICSILIPGLFNTVLKCMHGVLKMYK